MTVLWKASWQRRLDALIEGERCSIFGLSTAGAVLAGSGVSAAGNLAGGKKSSNAATQAAQIQAQYEQQALAFQEQVYANNANNLNPYIQFGTQGIPALQTAVNNITQAPPFTFQPTQAQLSGMPGYQWTQDQAMQAVRNSGSATGPGGATNYQLVNTAGGVASTYENQFYNQAVQTFQTQQQQRNAQLAAAGTPVQTGLTAAGALAGVNIQGIANTLSNLGATAASGISSSANALTAGLVGATNSFGSGVSNAAMLGLLGGNQTAAAQPDYTAGGYGYTTQVGGGQLNTSGLG